MGKREQSQIKDIRDDMQTDFQSYLQLIIWSIHPFPHLIECGVYRREFFLLKASMPQQQFRNKQNVKQ